MGNSLTVTVQDLVVPLASTVRVAVPTFAGLTVTSAVVSFSNVTADDYGPYGGNTWNPATNDRQIKVTTLGTKTKNNVAKLIVEGRFITDRNVSGGTIEYDIEASAIAIRSSGGNSLAINSTVKITGDGENCNSGYASTRTLADLYIAKGVTLTVNKDGVLDVSDKDAGGAQIMGNNATSQIIVNGHAEIDGVPQAMGPITVNSGSTLIAKKTVQTNVIIGDDGTDYGRFDGTVTSAYTVKLSDNITPSVAENKPFDVKTKLSGLKNGAVFIANVEGMKIKSVPKGVTLVIDADDVVIIGSIGTKDIVITSGHSLVLAGGTKIEDDAREIFKTATGAIVTEIGGTEDVTIIDEASGNIATSNDAKTAVGNISGSDKIEDAEEADAGDIVVDDSAATASLPFVLKTVSQSEYTKLAKDDDGEPATALKASDLTFSTFDADNLKVTVSTAFKIEEYDESTSPWFDGTAIASEAEDGTGSDVVMFGGESKLTGSAPVKYAIILNLYSKYLAGKAWYRYKGDWGEGVWTDRTWASDGNQYIVIGKNGDDETKTDWIFSLVGEDDEGHVAGQLKITVDWSKMTVETSTGNGSHD